MANYVKITEVEMDALLLPQGFVPVTLEGTKEKVYGKRCDRDGRAITLRVYSSIVDGESRGNGGDAIHVAAFMKADDRIVKISGDRRVHRVARWRDNLQNRIDNFAEAIGPACPRCSAPTVKRNGRYGEFFGCSTYPQCTGTCQCS